MCRIVKIVFACKCYRIYDVFCGRQTENDAEKCSAFEGTEICESIGLCSRCIQPTRSYGGSGGGYGSPLAEIETLENEIRDSHAEDGSGKGQEGMDS